MTFLLSVPSKYIMYADDMVLLSHEPQGLQTALNQLQRYADKNDLTVNNVGKTKCMVFHLGFCPRRTFFYNGLALENCNQFTYLGVVFTTQLSSTAHVQHVLSKCNQRIGYLFCRLPLKKIPLPVVLHVFATYILPILTYAAPLWFPKCTKESKRKINSLFTKFLKRYLGLPYGTYNAIVHYITNTSPICQDLAKMVKPAFYKVCFPQCLGGVRFPPPEIEGSDYKVIEEIPTYFWLSTVLNSLPLNPESRRALLYDTIDLHHCKICVDGSKHPHPTMWCLCKLCGSEVKRFHYRDCPELKSLTPCARMRKLEALTNE